MAQKIAKYLGNLCKKSWLQELLKNAKSGHTGYIVRSKTTFVVVSGRASRQLDKRLLVVVVVGPIIVIIISRWLPIIECGTTYCLPMAYPDHKHPQVRGAAIAQWICMRLPSWCPGFESQAHHLRFYHLQYFYYIIHVKRTQINKKRPGLVHFCKKTSSGQWLWRSG